MRVYFFLFLCDYKKVNKLDSQKLIIYTDGGSRGNPGPSAIGVVIKNADGNLIKKYGDFLGEKTNNEAEYEAVIFALKKAKALFGKEAVKKMQIVVKMDSELVKKQLNGEYKIEEERLFPYFIKIWNLKMDFEKVEFLHLPREQNKEADTLVNQVLNEKENRQQLF